jgi:isocitrate dehydrogenase
MSKLNLLQDGKITVLKESTPLKVGEIIDSSVMHLEALKSFVTTIEAKEKISCYRSSKATMMKVSDQLFLVIVEVYFASVFENMLHWFDDFTDTRNGLGDTTLKLLDDQNKQQSGNQ